MRDEAPRNGMQPAPGGHGPDAAPASPGAGEVAAFLRADPGWLAAHPELYAVLDPPARVYGERMADHMAAMLHRARADATALQKATSERRAADSFAERVQDGVLALMGARNVAWCLQNDLAGVLQLDSVRLCAEARGAPIPGASPVPPGTVAATLGRRRAIVRDAVRAPLLHGEAAALAGQEALARVPLPTVPALLAMACRDGRALAGATTPVLAFLGQAIAVALARG